MKSLAALQEEALRELFAYIPVSESALSFMEGAAAASCVGHSLEVYFTLLTALPEETPAPVTHVYLPRQNATGTSCAVTLEGKLEGIEYARSEGLALCGWAHSHGTLTAFHSDVDDSNTLARTHDSALPLQVSASISLHCASGTWRYRRKLQDRRVFQYAYSIVLCLASEPHAEVWLRSEDRLLRFPAGLLIIPGGTPD